MNYGQEKYIKGVIRLGVFATDCGDLWGCFG